MSRYVIDKTALIENVHYLQKKAGVPIIGVVKGNGYGFGLTELALILEHCGIRDYAIVTILAYAGLRISECLALRVEDISLPAREIKVRHGKGDKMRVVYFGDKVVNAVREYLRNRPKTENPYLFPGRGDSHLTRSQVNRIFNEYSESITPHTLRHFFCSNALENGYTIADLANQAGHSNVHTTLLYTNPTREKMKEKANRL